MSRKLTTQEFIEKALAVHGHCYDYSKSNYIDNKTKITIGCKKHGDFFQSPANHLQGFGCIKCGLKNAGQYHKKTKKSFVLEANAKHNSFYDYSKTIYKGAREKVTIICPKHGEFEQVASVHLRSESGYACIKCSYEQRGYKSRLSFEDFCQKSKQIHNNYYDYSLSAKHYHTTSLKIPIICPIHGIFEQSPGNHLSGKGCPHCSYMKIANSLRKTTEEFIYDAKMIHGEVYDYSNVKYEGAFKTVKIICPKDGIFEQSPTSHLGGIGCPKCSRRNQGAPRNLTRALRGDFDDGKESFVYVIKFELSIFNKPLYKVGSGTGSRMQTVVNSIKKVGGINLTINRFDFNSSGEAIVFEHLVHEQLNKYKFVIPPEYKFAGYSEIFTLHPDLRSIENHPTLKMFRLGERWKTNSY